MVDNIWTGAGVRLRPIAADDWESFHRNDYDTEIARLCDVTHFPRSAEGARRWAEQQAFKAPEGDNFRFAVETIGGELVGSINAHSCDVRHGTFKYGLGIFREHWRKGYASEAIGILLRYYFGELRYRKVTVHIYAFNAASVALHEKLGFKREGTLRSMIFTNGRHFDEYVYGLLSDEQIP